MTGCRILLLLLGCSYQQLCAQLQSAAALDILLVVDNSGSMRSSDPGFSIPGALSAFAERLPPNSTTGVIAFDKNVNVVLESGPVAGARFRTNVRLALGRLTYRGSLSDVPAAVERAIYELRQQGRATGRRAIVLVTDGVLDLGNASLTSEKSRWLREDLALEARLHDIGIFSILVSQAADFQEFQTLAHVTRAEYYRALTPAQFAAAVAQIRGQLTRSAEVGEAKATKPSPPKRAAGAGIFSRPFVLGLIVVSLAFCCFVVLFARKRLQRLGAGEVKTVIEEPAVPSLSTVRDRGVAVSDLLMQANANVKELQAAADRYSLSSFKVLQRANQRCFTLARECVLLLDHLDIMIEQAQQRNEPTKSIAGARRRLCSLLETAQIEEIPVNPGDLFDGSLHVSTGAVGTGGPEGVVVGVSRKGYAMEMSGKSGVLIRAAEVTVSAKRGESRSGD